MMNWKTLYTVLLIVIIALFLRTYHLKTVPPGLYPDEAMNGSNALEAIRSSDYKVFYPENNGREGLFINIQAQFLKFLLPLNDNEPEPWMLRLPSAIFGTLTVLGLYFFVKTLFSEGAALFSSFFLATSFWHILFSRIGFRAIMAPLLLVWSLYFLTRAIWHGSEKKPKLHVWLALVGGALYGLGFYTYIAYRVTPLLFLMFLPFFKNMKNFWRVFGIFLLATFVVALPLGMYYLANPADFLGRTAQVSVFSSETPLKDLAVNTVKTLGMFHVRGDWNWRHNFAGKPELFWPVGIVLIVGLATSAYYSLRMRDARSLPPLLTFGWFALALLPVVVSNEGIPHALRSILLVPPVFIFAGVGANWIYERLKTRTALHPLIRNTAITALAVVFFAEAYISYFIFWAKNPNTPGAFSADYVELGKTINALPRNTPKYVVVRSGGTLVRGIPMPAQTVMYITNTYGEAERKEKNVHYLLPDEEDQIPRGSLVFYL
ncbi:hypothetical protein C4571_01845 [Candidatus Parcubacteria bacterium]|nr:MAG: hypothetical protein C4571_01845 [Candidatus Parcubacteria bacterium]